MTAPPPLHSSRSSSGRVFLVGAGPGDPGLLTLRGRRCLAEADVVLYDYLVNPRLLEHCPPAAECTCVGQHGRGRLWTQDEINSRLVELARAGRRVVRLKGGDPAVFARSAEEATALEAAGVPYEIVPGITAALAAGSYAGIPLTHRESASAVALVTGREDDDKTDSSLDFAALARFPGTLVFYMGVTTARRWSSALIAAGKSPDTPAAIVRRCSLPDQQTVRCTLGELAAHLESPVRMRPPAIVIVGDVAASQHDAWFVERPLFGRRILVTRAEGQAADLREPLEALGAEVLVQPAVAVRPLDDFQELDARLRRLDEFDWIVFSSVNGVRAVCERLLAIGLDMRAFGGRRIAAVGPASAAALREFGLRADRTPDDHRAEGLAAALAPDAPGRRFLLVRASRGRETLGELLREAGGQTVQVVAYQNLDVDRPAPEVAQALAEGRIDWTTVTSSALARSLVAMFGDALERTRLVSLSPLTSATLRELGRPPAAEASIYTMPGLIDALLRAEAG